AQRIGRARKLLRVTDRCADELTHAVEILRRLDEAAARPRPPPGQTDVLGDLVEPGRLELRDDAALESAEGVQERRLDGVLGFFAVAQLQEAVGEDLAAEALVEVARRLGGRVGGRREGTTYRRSSCHNRPPR